MLYQISLDSGDEKIRIRPSHLEDAQMEALKEDARCRRWMATGRRFPSSGGIRKVDN